MSNNNSKTKLIIKSILALAFIITPLFSVAETVDSCTKVGKTDFEAELSSGFFFEESSIQLEEWMTDMDRWIFPGKEFQEINDTVLLESWMMSNDHWEASVDALQDVSDDPLKPWMFDPSHWKFISRDNCLVKHMRVNSDEDKISISG